MGMKIFGLIGYPLRFSLSRWMMMEVARRENLDISYHTFPIKPERLQQGIKALLALKIQGFQVTHPFKEKILPLLTDIEPEALSIGAVNTVVIQPDATMIGYNTDEYGFEKALEGWLKRSGLALPGQGIILGTGGASRAVASALLRRLISPVFISRGSRGELFVGNQKCPVYPYSELSLFLRQPAILVNATPLGAYPDVHGMPPVPIQALTPEHLVYDLNYYPPSTRLMEEAKKRGSPVENGLSMLFHQGARSLEVWTGTSVAGTFLQVYQEIQEGRLGYPAPLTRATSSSHPEPMGL